MPQQSMEQHRKRTKGANCQASCPTTPPTRRRTWPPPSYEPRPNPTWNGTISRRTKPSKVKTSPSISGIFVGQIQVDFGCHSL